MVFAAPASAAIVPGESIGGVEIGATQKVVEKALGTPSGKVDTGHGDIKLEWRRLRLQVLFSSGKVFWVRTKSKSQRTAAGLGRGTRVARLRAALEGEHCNARYCTAGARNDKRVTTYYLRRGVVTAVEVGRVQAVGVL